VIDAAGRIVQQGRSLQIGQLLPPGARVVVDSGVGAVTPEQLQTIRFRIDGAQPAQ
jgi:hypothetical protein